VIGVEVLGRPEGYSPAEDSSVRTRRTNFAEVGETLFQRIAGGSDTDRRTEGAYAPHYVKPAAISHTDPPVETAM